MHAIISQTISLYIYAPTDSCPYTTRSKKPSLFIMATINDHCWPEPIVPVQTLSNSGVPTVPQQYIKPPSERPCGSITSMNSPDLSIPIIDLACFYDISEHPLLQESICAAWPKWAPWRAPLLPATVNRWPASEAGHRGARCGKMVYGGGPPYLPAVENRYLSRRAV